MVEACRQGFLAVLFLRVAGQRNQYGVGRSRFRPEAAGQLIAIQLRQADVQYAYVRQFHPGALPSAPGSVLDEYLMPCDCEIHRQHLRIFHPLVGFGVFYDAGFGEMTQPHKPCAESRGFILSCNAGYAIGVISGDVERIRMRVDLGIGASVHIKVLTENGCSGMCDFVGINQRANCIVQSGKEPVLFRFKQDRLRLSSIGAMCLDIESAVIS